MSGCRKGDACPGDVVWEASPSHLQGAGFGAGGEVPVAPVDPPRITCAGISLSPSGVVGSIWGCRGNKVNSRGFLEWYPPVDSLASLPPAGDALHSPAGVRHWRGGASCRLRAARRRMGPGSQDSRFSPARPLPGSVRMSPCLGFLICPVSHSGGSDGVMPQVSGRVLPSVAGQGKRDSPWLSWSSVQTRGPVWTWAPSAHRPARGLHLPPLLLGFSRWPPCEHR